MFGSADEPSDATLSHFTLLQYGALLAGHQEVFKKWVKAAEGGAAPTRRRDSHLGNFADAVHLHELHQSRQQEEEKVQKSVMDEFVSWSQPRFHADIESDILSDSSNYYWRGWMQKKLRERDGSN